MNSTTPRPQRVFTVTPYLNVATDDQGRSLGFDGYQVRHRMATSGDLQLHVKAATPEEAAERAFGIGNRMERDLTGREWPEDVRSLSVGDAVVVRASGGATLVLSCERAGWEPLGRALRNPTVPLPGTVATSRKAC